MNISCCKSYVGKQIIGLLPNESECLFYYSPNVDVQGWFIDGIDTTEVGSINGILNPYGYSYNFFFLIDGTYRFILSYIGTTPPTYLPVILDSGSNPVTWTLTNCCDLVCLEGTFNAADAVYLQTGYGWNWYNGAAIFNHPSVEEAIKSLYGTQTIYTATDNGDGTFYIKIDNAFVCNLPLSWSEDNVTYTDMVPCGTPPPTLCAYYNQFIDNSATCFAGGSYDFEGCLIDFNCLASFYPNGYYVQDGANLTFDYCSHLTVMSNSTSLPAPINYLDYNGNPQTSDWTALCDYGCVQSVSLVFKPTSYITSMSFCGIDIEFFSYGGNLDLYDTVNAELILFGIFKAYFPTCTAVNITDIGGGNLRITVFDIYSNISSGTWLMEDFLGFTYILGIEGC